MESDGSATVDSVQQPSLVHNCSKVWRDKERQRVATIPEWLFVSE
jgi:hypothetical protein